MCIGKKKSYTTSCIARLGYTHLRQGMRTKVSNGSIITHIFVNWQLRVCGKVQLDL